MDEEAIVLSRGVSTRVGAKCRRWNPTTEQVKVLSDLFASGLRTPTTEQIQTISSHLSSFGKIESKNVFYWFQNHKARERHHKKRRRQQASGLVGSDHICHKAPDISKKEANRTSSCNKIVHEQEAIWEQREREVETLQLFPLSSYSNWEGETLRTIRNEWAGIEFLDAADPPLDLRLSFL